MTRFPLLPYASPPTARPAAGPACPRGRDGSRPGPSLWPLLGLFLVWNAAPVQAMSLQEAMNRSLQHHPSLAAHRANVRALNEDIDQARAGWRPSFSVTLSAGRRHTHHDYEAGGVSSAGFHNKDVRISASQPLLDWTTGPQVDGAQARMLQGHADLRTAEQKVMLEAATAYLNVLQYRTLLTLHDAHVESLTRQVSYRSEHYRRQLGTLTELAQAQARHASAVAQRDRVQSELEIAVSAFLRHVGVAPGTDLQFPEHLPALPADLDAILEAAIHHTPAVQSARYGVDAAQADSEAAKGQLKPALKLEALGGWGQRPDVLTRRSRDAAVQLTLQIPIYQGGALRAQVRSRQQRVVQQQSLWRDTTLQARQDATEAWRRLHAARAEISAYTQAVKANRLAYEGVAAEYAALGELTLIEVLNAEQELFMAEVSLVQARTRALMAHLQLLAAQGQLGRVIADGEEADRNGTGVSPPRTGTSVPAVPRRVPE